MDHLTRDDLKTLLAPQDGLHVSIYMPTYRAGGETQQNPIRFKNLLREAETRLLATTLTPDAVDALLAPLRPYTDDHHFWQHQSDGLVMLRRSELFQPARLPIAFEELVVISRQFHLKPLLPYFTGDGRFYVLALSQNDVRMVQCTHHHASEMALDNVPTSLAEALQFDDPEQQLQYHTGVPGGGGQRSPVYHGQGGGKDTAKEDLFEYFRHIDQGLHDILRDEHAPLVLAGVDYLLPIYQQANTYHHLIDEGITGNPEHHSPEALQSLAWPLVQPFFHQAQADARAAYERHAATERASDEVTTIVQAAHQSRIDTLFVALGRQQWGSFDPDTQQLQLVSDPQEGAADDLLNVAATQTLLHGGAVYAMEPDRMPTQRDLAAVFRY
jgi:hypothetical protein